MRLQVLRTLKVKRDEQPPCLAKPARIRAGRLTDAFERASDAVSLDPDNQEGRLLFESIENAIQAREAEGALDAEICAPADWWRSVTWTAR